MTARAAGSGAGAREGDMAEKTLEEAWEAFLSAQLHEGPGLRDRETGKAACALALAVLEEATNLWLSGHFNDSDKLRRRIEELGR